MTPVKGYLIDKMLPKGYITKKVGKPVLVEAVNKDTKVYFCSLN